MSGTNQKYLTLLRKVLISLEKLKENSSFFISAIELEWDLDGEEYEKEINELIREIKECQKQIEQ